MATLRVLGAYGHVGGSCILVEDRYGNRVAMDYGVKLAEKPDKPPTFPDRVDGVVTDFFLTHAHLDHSAGVPLVVSNNYAKRLYATEVTKDLYNLLGADFVRVNMEKGIDTKFDETDVESVMRRMEAVAYRAPIELRGDAKAELLDAGHIPGSAMVGFETEGKYLLYTGDFNTKDTRLVRGCEGNIPDVDILVTESTYSGRNHPSRESQERKLAEIVKETLGNDGTALIAGFGVARLDEIILALNSYGLLDRHAVYLDGMARKESKILKKHNYTLHEPDIYVKALEKVKRIDNHRMREIITDDPSIILSTSGMLQAGPIVHYMKKLNSRNNSLVLTGYQAENTPGRKLLETGHYINEESMTDFEVDMRVEQLDFSGHAGGDDLVAFVKKLNPGKVFCVHGDSTEEFAKQLRELGFDAVAPSRDKKAFDI